MRNYGCRGCMRRFSVTTEGPAHTTHAAFCPLCGGRSISDMGEKASAVAFAEAEQRQRVSTGREI